MTEEDAAGRVTPPVESSPVTDLPAAAECSLGVPQSGTPAPAALPPEDQPGDPRGAAEGARARARERIKIGSQRARGRGNGPKSPAPQPPVVVADVATRKVPPPNPREGLAPELEQEVAQALGQTSVEQMLSQASQGGRERVFEHGERATGVVSLVRGDQVFVDLGGRAQGVASRAQFKESPQVGSVLECIVLAQNPEDGLYEVSLSGGVVDVGDWSQLSEGMVVEARVTGMNTGGLECDVNGLRGFIPTSQIALYRVESLAEFMDQRFFCVVTEVNARKKNLVLSRRAVLEREKAEARDKIFAELAVGQLREGVVRKICDFGAFVDLGGVDGLIHVSQLSWDHIKHPSDVLAEGQRVRVKIQKIDPQTRRIGLAYRDLTESPWAYAADKYHPGDRVQGTVSKLTDFGAFVRLEAGLEGLIHVSELAHRRVQKPADVVSQGQDVETQVLSIDVENQRIALSLKALQPRPEPAPKQQTAEERPSERFAGRRPKKNLRGGVGGSSGGEQFGLRW